MHVQDVDFSGFDGPEPEGMKPGTVSLIARNGRIEIALTAPARVSPWKGGLRRRILAKAVTKVLRLPEFRSGAEPLTFEKGLGAPPDRVI